MPPHLCPDNSAQYAPAGTIALHVHPIIPSNLTSKQAFDSDTVILHVSSSGDPTLTLQYWITTKSTLPTFTQDSQESAYNVLYLDPLSSEAERTRLYPKQAISKKIYVRLNKKTSPMFLPLVSLMSKSPTPTTPLIHNSLSNQSVDPTMALIALMHKSLQKNAAMMAKLHYRPSTPPA